MKGYKDFNQLQAEMKAREKELKKKLKKAKTAQEKSTASSTPTTTNNNEEVDNGEEDSSDVENDLPEQYIEEIVTERQFIDSDGQVKTEVTTTEVTDLLKLF